jgi:hypothetical protein
MAASKMSRQNPASSDLPGRPNAIIRSPAVARSGNQRSGTRHGAFADINALICRYVFALTGETALPQPYGCGDASKFRSLRLSVRTPPFHGGESGSIPLGSAIYFNGLAQISQVTSSISPLRAVRAWCCAKVSAGSEIRNSGGYSLTVQQGSRSLRLGAHDRWCTMRDEFASKSFLAVTVAGLVLLCSGLVAFAFN